MRRALLALAFLATFVLPTAALAWDNAPPVVDCSGTSHPPLSYGTEDAYHAAVAQQAATVCQTAPAAPPATSQPASTAIQTSQTSNASVASPEAISGHTATVAVCQWEATPAGGQWLLVHPEASTVKPLASEQNRSGTQPYTPDYGHLCGPLPVPSAPAPISILAVTLVPTTAPTVGPLPPATAQPTPTVVEPLAPAVVPVATPPLEPAEQPRMPSGLPETGDGSCSGVDWTLIAVGGECGGMVP